MSSNTSETFTKEQLFAALENDGIEVDSETCAKAKNDDGEALNTIGFRYKKDLSNHSKAMAWYKLSANQNYPIAYHNIGCSYVNGEGVLQDFDAAMDYFLKGAAANQTASMVYIGSLFGQGKGAPLDRYKSLEWLHKTKLTFRNGLVIDGMQLSEEDKKKTVYQLINETMDIRREYIKKREEERNEFLSSAQKGIQDISDTFEKWQQQDDLREKEKQNQAYLLEKEKKKLADSLEKEKQRLAELLEKERQQQAELLKKERQQQTELLEKERQQQAELLKKEKQQQTDLIKEKQKNNNDEELLKLSVKYLEQQLKEKDKTASLFEALVKSKSDEIDLLRKEIRRCSNLEDENKELRRELDRLQEPISLARDNNPTDDTNDNNNITDVTISNSTELDNNNIEPENQNVDDDDDDDIIVKIEESDSTSCRLGNKKRKVSSIGAYDY